MRRDVHLSLLKRIAQKCTTKWTWFNTANQANLCVDFFENVIAVSAIVLEKCLIHLVLCVNLA